MITPLFILIFVVLLVQVLLAPIEAAVVDNPEIACRETEGISEYEASTLFAVRNGEPSEKLKCYSACILEQTKILDGCTYQLESALQFYAEMKQEALFERLKSCTDSAKGSDRCECGYNVFKCITNYEAQKVEEEK